MSCGPTLRHSSPGAGPDNLARTMRYLTLMGQVSPLVAEKFRTGGGLSYTDYPDFHHLMAEDSAAVNDASLIDTILPLTGLVDRLQAGIDVADVGCGEGHAINLMAQAFPASRFTGIDFSDDALTVGRAEAAAWGLTNVDLRDPGRGHDRLRGGVRPDHGVRRHPRPGSPGDGAGQHPSRTTAGRHLLDDRHQRFQPAGGQLELPWASFLYAVSTVHCMSVSLGQGGDGLGTVWGVQTAERMLAEAGFTEVRRHELEQDPFNAYFVARA